MITQSRSPAVTSARPGAARFTTHQGRTGRLISVAGHLDAAGAEQLLDHVLHGLCGEWLVLDLTAVDFMDSRGTDSLHAINSRCAHLDVRWSLIAGNAAARLLSSCDRDGGLPLSDSLTAALASVQKLPNWRATTDGVAGRR